MSNDDLVTRLLGMSGHDHWAEEQRGVGLAAGCPICVAAARITELEAEISVSGRLVMQQLHDRCDALEAENARLRELLTYIPSYETEPCRLDHHGYCQDHPGGFREGGCWVAAARAALSGEPT